MAIARDKGEIAPVQNKENKSLFSWPTLKLRRQFDSRKTVIREDPTGSLFICFVYFKVQIGAVL